MSSLPVAEAFGSVDVVEMQPLPSPENVYKYSSASLVQHALSEGTNAIWVTVPRPADAADDRYLLASLCPADEFDAEHAIPLFPGVWPLAVAEGGTVTLQPLGTSGYDFWIQEARL